MLTLKELIDYLYTEFPDDEDSDEYDRYYLYMTIIEEKLRYHVMDNPAMATRKICFSEW